LIRYETVEIDSRDAGGDVAAISVGEQFTRLLKKPPAVHQPGQLVDPGQPFELVKQYYPFRFDFLAVPDIVHEGQKPPACAVGLDLEGL